MYTLISGSQKNHPSNSRYFLDKIGKYLDEYNVFDLSKDEYQDILDSIYNSDTIVIAFPLYVDSPNSVTIEFLDYIFDNKIDLRQKKLYVVINCGFREGKQNITALNIIKNWCEKCKVKYSGSILIGAGEIVGKPKFQFITKKAHKNLKEFSLKIKNNTPSDDIITSMDLLNNHFYCLLANKSWTKQGKDHGLTKEGIRQI